MDVHPSALKHGVAVEDIQHAVRHAMAIDELADELPLSGAGPRWIIARVITLFRDDEDDELVIHAMVMRAKYGRLLGGE